MLHHSQKSAQKFEITKYKMCQKYVHVQFLLHFCEAYSDLCSWY